MGAAAAGPAQVCSPATETPAGRIEFDVAGIGALIAVGVLGVYGSSLSWFLRHRWISLVVWAACLAGTIQLFRVVPKTFLPPGDSSVVFGVFMYFPTLVEVPIAKMFLSLGMHRGPLLAYLMADPELSLQSILMISAIIGRSKAWVYVFWVALFSTVAGLIYGALEDGANIWSIALYLLAFLSLLAAGLWWMSKRRAARPAASPEVSEDR